MTFAKRISFKADLLRNSDILSRIKLFLAYYKLSRTTSFVVLLIVSSIVSGLYGLYLGQDVNADQRNYHFESAHEFLENRLTIDAAPAGIVHSYFNPLPYVPFYWLAMHLTARAVIFCLSAWDGLVIPLVFLIGYTIAHRERGGRRVANAALATIISTASPMALSEVGSTFADLELSPLILLGLLALLNANSHREPMWSRLFNVLGPLLIGLAVGLKLTNTIYVFGVAACCWLGRDTWRGRLEATALAGLGGAFGVAISGGFWFLKLWRLFRSPVFPYYDKIFVSPETPIHSGLHGHSFIDGTYLPHSLLDAAKFPFDWLFVAHRTSEIDFRDVRFALLSVALATAAATALWRYAQSRVAPEHLQGLESRTPSATGGKLLMFFGASFCAWAWQFAIQRYLVGLELLVGPALLSALSCFLGRWRLIAVMSAISLASWLTALPSDWGHIKPRRTWFDIHLPDPLKRPSLVFINNATSFVAPFLPQQTVVANVNFSILEAGSGAFDDRIVSRALADNAERPAYIITDRPVGPEPRRVLAGFGLRLESPCWPIGNAVEFLAACPLQRAEPKFSGAPLVHPGQTIEFGSTLKGLPYVLSGWTLDASWGLVGGGYSPPTLILRTDAAFGNGPALAIFSLDGFGKMLPEDTLTLSANQQVVARWRLGDIGVTPIVRACLPGSSFNSDHTTILTFDYERPTAHGVDKTYASTIALERLTVDKGELCPKEKPVEMPNFGLKAGRH